MDNQTEIDLETINIHLGKKYYFNIKLEGKYGLKSKELNKVRNDYVYEFGKANM